MIIKLLGLKLVWKVFFSNESDAVTSTSSFVLVSEKTIDTANYKFNIHFTDELTEGTHPVLGDIYHLSLNIKDNVTNIN